MSDYSELCDIVEKYVTGKKYRNKIFKYKKYPKSRNDCLKYCVFLYKALIKFIDRYHSKLYNGLTGQEKAKLRDEIFFPLAQEKFYESYNLLEDRIKKWYKEHPYRKVKK